MLLHVAIMKQAQAINMTTRYTDTEWRAIISDVARELEVWEQDYCPDLDALNIARTIDHTLLKLDATPKQIDDLCVEARVANFAVRLSWKSP
jgi:deoxyribose-phosphate aldolase